MLAREANAPIDFDFHRRRAARERRFVRNLVLRRLASGLNAALGGIVKWDFALPDRQRPGLDAIRLSRSRTA